MTDGNGFTVKEIVLEIRRDLKALNDKVDQIDRKGSIGTREELSDHESRLRGLERFRYAVPSAAVIAALSAVGMLAYVVLTGTT